MKKPETQVKRTPAEWTHACWLHCQDLIRDRADSQDIANARAAWLRAIAKAEGGSK